MRTLHRCMPPALTLALLFAAADAQAAKKWFLFGGGQNNTPASLSKQDRDTVTQIHVLARQNSPTSTQLALDHSRAMVGKAGGNAMVCKAGLCAVDSAVKLDVATLRSAHASPAARQGAQQRLNALGDHAILRQFVGDADASRVIKMGQRVQQLDKTPRATRPGDTLILYLGGKL